MAIYQISKITQRKGLQIDLPQLSGAEFGWSVDERKLWIGNGTLAEGAPVVGNTEILTEFSDILALPNSYTFEGASAGYTAQTGPTPSTPITQSLQTWLDQWVSVKDFGATGDGSTDDTLAINRALYQIYCRAPNAQVRRGIYFPAGIYLVSDTIAIPPYAKLYGDGAESSIIQLAASSTATCTAATADSMQQMGISIGNAGATPPTQIYLANLGFSALSMTADAFHCDCANGITFAAVNFFGGLSAVDLTDDTVFNTAAVRFSSTAIFPCADVNLIDCEFTGTTVALTSASADKSLDYVINGLTADACEFGQHFRGVTFGTGATVLNGGPTGCRIINNLFHQVYAEGVIFGACELNATGYNIFYDVGNHFQGYAQPYTAVIDILGNNNLSIGDLFQRTDAYAGVASPGTSYPRVVLNGTLSIGYSGSSQVAMGAMVRTSGYRATLADAIAVDTLIVNSLGSALVIYTENCVAFKIDYTIIRGTAYRTGTLTVATDSGAGDLTYDDTNTENKPTGILLVVSQLSNVVSVMYQSTAIGTSAQFIYSITYLA